MPAYKDKAKGTWYASFYYEDWTGKKVKKMKRGFPTKREALEWERTFLQQQTADLEMTFENFVAVYVADMKGRIKENTWGTKEHILYKKLVPYFGKRKMCDIHSKEVIAWQNEMLGYRDKNGKPYSPVYLKTLHNQLSADSEEGQLAAAVLDEYMKGFQERNPQLRVFSAHLHMDEATPHLHIDFVPFTTGSKRGLDTRVSLKQALAAQGFQGGTRGDTEWSQWVRSEKEQLSLVMERHGIEWEDKGTHDKHLSVLDYKKEQRAKEIAVLETVKAEKENQVESQERRLKELAPAVKNMERLAADFSANPEEILPEPGTLETGRAYREKKAKPLLAQIVKVLRSLYLAYVELRGKFERLQGDYGRVRESNIRLSDRLQEVKLENKAMRQVSADYERVKRAFGPEQVDRILEAAYQQEHAEKERKRAAKSKIRIDAR